MKKQKPFQWSRLDNAAKIFPPSSTPRDPKVFRFLCELNEEVQPDALQAALDQTLRQFPLYRAVLKKGLFWYYLEDSAREPKVEPETQAPLTMLYRGEGRDLLFRVTWYRRRINLEVYHALSDGTGALHFLRMLVYHYLLIVHGEDFPDGPPPIAYDASHTQQMDDSFAKYSGSGKKAPMHRSPHAYHLHGDLLPVGDLSIIEGNLPLRPLLAAAKARGTTLTVFLAAVLVKAIHGQMSMRDQRRPVVVSVPVNLRNYFPSETARNFFSVLNVSYDFTKGDGSLEDIIRKLSGDLKENLTEEKLSQKLNRLAALEQAMLVRVIPLFIKKPILRFSHWMAEHEVTAAFSNIGPVDMPEALRPRIRLFEAFLSTKRMQATMASFGEHFIIAFTTPFVSTEVQRGFFRILSDMGLCATITTNEPDPEEAD